MMRSWDFKRLTTLAVLGLAILSLGPLFGYYLASPSPSGDAVSRQSVVSIPPFPDQFQAARQQYLEQQLLTKVRRAARTASQLSDQLAGAGTPEVPRIGRTHR